MRETVGPIDVIVVARVRVHRDALSCALAGDQGIRVTASFASVFEAIDAVAGGKPAIIVVDAAELRFASLGLVEFCRGASLVVYGVATQRDLALTLGVGASACLDDHADTDALVEAIYAISRDQMWCSPRLGGALLRRSVGPAQPISCCPALSLTRRELEVLALVDRGLANKEIASRLSIALPTVKNHMRSVCGKLNVTNRWEAAASARMLLVDSVGLSSARVVADDEAANPDSDLIPAVRPWAS